MIALPTIAMRGIAVVLLSMAAIASAPAQAGPRPAACDALPDLFQPAPRKGLSAVHQAALDLGRIGARDVASEARRILPELDKLFAQVVSRDGAQSRAAGLLRLDMANTVSKLSPPNHNLAAALRRDALAILSRYDTPDAVEATLWLDRLLNPRSDPAGRSGQALQYLRMHRRAAGDMARAAPLWRDAIATARNMADREQLAREQLAVATRLGHGRWILEARSQLLSVLIERQTGHTPAQLAQNYTLRTSLIKAQPNNSEILQLARAAMPEIENRLGWNSEINGAYCNWVSGELVTLTAKIVIAIGTEAERKPALRLAVIFSTSSGPFETDYAGSVHNMMPTLAARTVDRELYLTGLTDAANKSLGDCSIAKHIPAICSLRTLANSLTSMAVPQLAIPLLADAVELAEAKGAGDGTRALLLVEAAELEWQSGTAAEAPRLLERAEGLLRGNAALARSEANLKALRLRALIADAQLDDRRALDSFQQLVRLSIDLNRKRTGNQKAMAVGNSGADAETDTAYRAARELVHRHLRQRFCEGCGGASGGAGPALDWMRAVFGSEPDSGFIPTMEDYLLSWTLPQEAWSADTQKWVVGQFKASLSRQFGEIGKGAAPAFAELGRILPKASEESRLRTLALSQLVHDDTDLDAGFSQLRAFITFLNEQDIDKKRALWNAYYPPIAENTSDQFGTDAAFYQTLDALARGARTSGYRLAARVVFESLVDRIAPGASQGTVDAGGIDALTINAGVAVPALTRIAASAIERKEWRLSHRILDLAAAVIRQRLSTEWRSGNDRIAAGLNDLRAAIRLTAQLRADLAEDPDARKALPDVQAKLFSDLQMAMFSDTAVVAQSVDRRRVAASTTLAAAIRRRDQAEAAIAAAEKFRFVSEQYSLTTVEDTVRTLSAAKNSAAAEIQRLMPVAEDALNPAPVALEAVQRMLTDGEGMLLLHAGSHAVYGQLVTRSGAPVSWIGKMTAQDLEQRIRTVRAGIDVSSGNLPPFPFEDAFALHQALLGPIKAELGSVRRLLVLADGPLHSLPLAILPTEPVTELPAAPDEMRSAKVPWLVRKHAITILTSAASLSLRNTGQLGSRAKVAFAGIGNPVLLGPPGGRRGIDLAPAFSPAGRADVDALRKLPALPETATEITILGQMLSASRGDLKLGAAASESEVKRMPLANYRIITFATHGLVAGAVTGASEPGLVLTPPAVATPEDDGFLGASEIAALKLDADLVVLSACNTAASDGRPRAEGLSGLARSFLAAGARGIVATHWAIPSGPTVELTTRMVKAKQSGAEASWAGALQSAMLDIVDRVGPAEFAHPANWGAFLAVGLAGENRMP